MALRQYIGARYVPKFYENGAWTANTAYEALTIVTRNGNSYTSKKPVPATVGAPESNPEYWVSTGIYNAQVEELREDIDSNTSRISAIEGQYEQKRRYILIGDSYGQGWNGEIDVVGWCERFKTISGLSNYDCYDYARGGAGFVHTPTFLSEIQSVAVKDPETITDIVVAGGYNDHSFTQSDISTAIGNFYNYARSTYPNARIWLGFIGASRAAGSIRTELNTVKVAYSIANGFLHLDSTDIFTQVWSGCYGTDDFHLSENGYKYVGDFIWAGVHGGFVNVTTPIRPLNPTFTTNFSSSGQLRYWVNNDIITLSIPTNYRINIGAEKPAAGTFFKLADMPAPFFGREDFYYNSLPLRGVAHYANGGFAQLQGSMSINNQSLNMRISSIVGTAFIDLSNVDYIILDPTTYYIPASEIV